MHNYSANNQRIAKNALYLYVRMFITMLVGFYTTRVVLNALGVSDYGVYDVMGGIIGMLTYINTLLAGGTARFLTIALGKGNQKELNDTFAMGNSLGVLSSGIILLFGETIGLWFVNTHLNISLDRMEAANWVYQCALFSCCLTVMQTPYTASIISHERMDIYAYMSIFDVVMKLFIVFMLTWLDFDKLRLYAILIFAVNFLNIVIYRCICIRLFEEAKLKFFFDKTKFNEMISYSGWNMVGAFANILNNYGLNILLNIFFCTIVNAARGIAMQVGNIVRQFYSNFLIAFRPQITKYYAQGDINGMCMLICNSSKYSSLMLLCLIIPIAFNIDDFLQLWLGQKPEYTAWFVRIIMVQILYQAIDTPLGIGIHAVGKMKLPNITAAFFYLSVFPITWIALRMGAGPIVGYCVYLAFTPFILMVDMLILRSYSGFSIRRFLTFVIAPVTLIALIGSLLSMIVVSTITKEGIYFFILRVGISFAFTCGIVWIWGLPPNIRKVVVMRLPIIKNNYK